MDVDEGAVFQQNYFAIQAIIIKDDVEVKDNIRALVLTREMRVHVDFPCTACYHLKGGVVEGKVDVGGFTFF